MNPTKKPKKKSSSILSSISKDENSTDILGSYTGTPKDGGMPEQDADDL